MKHKKLKIFAIIVLVILVSLLFLGNCKKTKALEINSDANNLGWFVLFNDTYTSTNNTYYFYETTTNYKAVEIIFGSTGYTIKTYEEDETIIGSWHNNWSDDTTITGYPKYLLVYVRPGQDYLYWQQLYINLMQSNTTPQFYYTGGDYVSGSLRQNENVQLGERLRFETPSNRPNLVWFQDGIVTTNSVNYIVNTMLNNQYLTRYGSIKSMLYESKRQWNYGNEKGYTSGYSQGYYEGQTEGEEIGYDNGYEDGYQVGYQDGASGETAISPAFRVISDVFTSIGSIMAIELVPHVPLGLFILVPLFFSALGLILWIWRRN